MFLVSRSYPFARRINSAVISIVWGRWPLALILPVLMVSLYFSTSVAGAASSSFAESMGGTDATEQLTAKIPKSEYEKQCQGLARSMTRPIAGAIKKSEGDRLRVIFDFQWKYLMNTYPEWATYVGYPGRNGQNGRWTDRSIQAIALRERELRCPLMLIKTINGTKLNMPDRLNYDLFRKNAEAALEGARFPDEFLGIDQLRGIHHDLAEVLGAMPHKTESEFKDIISRLKGASKLIDQEMSLLKEGLKRGITQPQIALREVPKQIQAMITEDALESPLLTSFKQMPGNIPKVKAVELKARATRIFTDEIKPSLLWLRKFLVEDYIPKARKTVGWKDLPMGESWYAYRVDKITTTNMSPKEIHEIGMSEVRRLRAEMEKLIQETGFKGNFEDFFRFLRTDERFFYSKPEDLLRDYRDIAKRIDPELAQIFGRLPRLPYGVKPIPEYAAPSAPTAYYQAGSAAAGRGGAFLANTHDLKSRPKWEMEALTLHEAVPGHHLQIALAQEMENGPEFRKHGGYTAFVEGWGLYAESLGYELGFYKDPYSRFGQLTYEMWRALRLVVDTGIHQFGWSREQAIDFMKTNLAKPEHDIVVEVDRYIVWAGQALAYKIGQLTFKELRAKASRELGDKFDLRSYHDLVLSNGALPLGVLEGIVNDWITTEKSKYRK